MGATITERDVVVSGIRIHCREVAGSGPPAIFVHGNPTQSGDWLPFLERMEGPALAFDLPGFGRSDRPDPDLFDHSIGAYANLIEELLEVVAPEGFRLVVHDWGVLGLIAALRNPLRIKGLVVINAVPLSGDYRWHWIARIWRRRGLGEAVNAVNSRFGTAQLLRLARPGRKRMSPEFVEMVWSGWDAGMSRAVLGLYRSADPPVLAAMGRGLGEVKSPGAHRLGDRGSLHRDRARARLRGGHSRRRARRGRGRRALALDRPAGGGRPGCRLPRRVGCCR